jgi:ribosomal protein S6--L-glutamate ligase
MNIGIVTVKDKNYHPNQRLIEAASQQGHRATLIHPYRVWPCLEGGKLDLIDHHKMPSADVVLPRQGATVGDSSLNLIRQLSLMGIPVVNDFDAIRLARNQFLTLMSLAAVHIPIPDSVFVNSDEGFLNALERLGGLPVVVKQVSSRQGQGVILVDTQQKVESMIRDYLTKRDGLLIQHFIQPAGRRDLRVLIVGGKVLGAVELKPGKGDFRANFHLSGASRSVNISPELQDIALRSADAVGLEIAGVDIILDQNRRFNVIEVNYSPGFRGFEAATGIDVAGGIINYVAATYG